MQQIMPELIALQVLTRAFDSGPQRSDVATSDTPVCWLTGMMDTASGADGEEEPAPSLLAVRFSPDPTIVPVACPLPGCQSRITALVHVPGARPHQRTESDAAADKEKEKSADSVSIGRQSSRSLGLFDGLSSRSEAKKKSSISETESVSPAAQRSGRAGGRAGSTVRDALRRFEQTQPAANAPAIRAPTPNVRILSGSTVRLNDADAVSVSGLSVGVPAGDTGGGDSEDSNELQSNHTDGDAASIAANMSAALPDATRDTLWIADLDCKYAMSRSNFSFINSTIHHSTNAQVNS